MEPISPLYPEPTKTKALPRLGRFFYPGAAALMLLLTIAGFREFYLHGKAYPDREIAPSIRMLVILHGAAMSAWVLLFFAQTLLIRGRRFRVHMIVGRLGTVLAAGILFLGLHLGVESTRITPPEARIWGLAPRPFMAIPLISIVVFGVFVALGIWQRRRPSVHKPMMLLATLAAVSAATSRISPLNALYAGTVWQEVFGPFFGMLLIAFALLVLKWLLTRSLDRWFGLGLAGLAATCALIMYLATTQIWGRFADYILG